MYFLKILYFIRACERIATVSEMLCFTVVCPGYVLKISPEKRVTTDCYFLCRKILKFYLKPCILHMNYNI